MTPEEASTDHEFEAKRKAENKKRDDEYLAENEINGTEVREEPWEINWKKMKRGEKISF